MASNMATKIAFRKGAMKRGQGMCSTFQSFQLTYHAHTTFIEICSELCYFSGLKSGTCTYLYSYSYSLNICNPTLPKLRGTWATILAAGLLGNIHYNLVSSPCNYVIYRCPLSEKKSCIFCPYFGGHRFACPDSLSHPICWKDT